MTSYEGRHRARRRARRGRHRAGHHALTGVLVAAATGAIAAAVLVPAPALPAPGLDRSVAATSTVAPPTAPVTPPPTTVLAPAPTTTPPPPPTTATPTTTRRATAPRTTPPPPPPPVVVCASTGWGVQPHVAQAGHRIAAHFGLLDSIVGGYRPSSAVAGSDHPKGLALDFMVGVGVTGRLLGDQIAAYALASRAELGVTYVIWRQRINYGSGWQAMPDRGGATANHLDHVHVSFAAAPRGGAAGLLC